MHTMWQPGVDPLGENPYFDGNEAQIVDAMIKKSAPTTATATVALSLCLSAVPIPLAGYVPAHLIGGEKTASPSYPAPNRSSLINLDLARADYRGARIRQSAKTLGASGTEDKTAEAGPEHPLPVPRLSGKARSRAAHCLALNIYHEARSEPRLGQEAVAAVTINRVASTKFPNSVCGVVQQGGTKRNRCQFSWWCDRRSDRPQEADAWARAQALSREALDGKLSDPTNGALYYHANYVEPRWSRVFHKTSRIGRHLFYKPRGA